MRSTTTTAARTARSATAGRLALTLALVACAPQRPASAPDLPPPPRSTAATTGAPIDDRIARDTSEWDALVCASQSPLRWARRRALRGPAIVVGDGLLVAEVDGGLALVDRRSGDLRWRSGPGSVRRWDAIAAGEGVAVAIGRRDEVTWLRAIDLRRREAVDRKAALAAREVFAVGPALALGDGCALDLLGPDATTILRAHGHDLGELLGRPLCGQPSLLIAADEAAASIVDSDGAGPRLRRVDRRGGDGLGELLLTPGARVVHDPRTGLLLETAPDGGLRALRVDVGMAGMPGMPGAPATIRRWDRLASARGVGHIDGPPLLLVREGRRWTAIDPLTLADRWSITSDLEVVILGEVTEPGPAAEAWAKRGELRWVDPASGATIARRRLPEARVITLLGDLALVEGSRGAVAIDVRSGDIRWAHPGRIEGVHAGGVVTFRGDLRSPRIDVVDARAGVRRLQVRLRATLLARVPDPDGDLSLLLLDDRSDHTPPAALMAFADDPASAEALSADPIVAFAPPCTGPDIVSLAEIDRYRGCHLHRPRSIHFAEGSAEVPAGRSAELDALARQWRESAESSATEAGDWPRLLVRAHRSAAEPIELAERRAGALREALIARGVACSGILAAADPDPVSTRVDITWFETLDCLL